VNGSCSLSFSSSSPFFFCTGLLSLINLFNTLSSVFATLIVQETRLRKRVVVCERLIELAVELRKLDNFLMVMSLVSTFAQVSAIFIFVLIFTAVCSKASINRLRFTLEKISDVHREKLRELQALMNPEKSFAQYRNAYNQSSVSSAHCIPYLGVYLTDLVFIEEATLSRVGGDDSGSTKGSGVRINVQKHVAVFNILDKLMVLKRKFPVPLEPIEFIQQWLAGLPCLSEKNLCKEGKWCCVLFVSFHLSS
jgi:hypothetical protein